MRATVIFNPSAGRGRSGAIASAVARGLAKRQFEVESHATEGPVGATAIARRCAPETDVIVAVGGDGTINEVANGMVEAMGGGSATGRRPALGIVPAGTVNVLALELGLPFQVERACNVIAGGKTVSLDLGRVNDRGFLLMMGAGIDALTVRNLDLRTKRRFKELAFVGTGLRFGLATKPRPLWSAPAGVTTPAPFSSPATAATTPRISG